VGTWSQSRTTQPQPDVAPYDCAGLYGPTCDQPMPRWRHVVRATWSTPWRVDLTGAWRYVGPANLDLLSSDPFLAGDFTGTNGRLGARSYFDLSLTWRLHSRLTLRAGARNVLDTDPPVIGIFNGGVNNGNTYVGLYDTLGRFIFVGLSARY
jgi:outer membrane receptor protein involved in Fe transport